MVAVAVARVLLAQMESHLWPVMEELALNLALLERQLIMQEAVVVVLGQAQPVLVDLVVVALVEQPLTEVVFPAL